MKPTNLRAAAQNAEQRVRIAVEQVKAAEKKARAAKDKAWRAKLLFKLARRASKKAKKAAKRARAKAVQAQIALKELAEQIAPATRLSARTRQSAPTPRRSALNQASMAAAHRNEPSGAPKVGRKPLGASTPQRPGQTLSAAKPIKAEAATRTAKRRPQALEAAEQGGLESTSTQLDESKLPTGLGDFGDHGIKPAQASPESPAANGGRW